MRYSNKTPKSSQINSTKAGFSLVQLSIILVIGGVVIASTLPGGGVGDDLTKERITLDRMEKIEEATQRFMTANQRRPYPSNLLVGFDNAAYGLELAVPTDYSSVPTTHFTTAASSSITVSTTTDNPLITITSGSTATITGLTNGWMVSGTNIPNYSWVDFINSTTSVTLNNNASATGVGNTTLSFRNPLVAGGVPTRTLGLPDEFGIDGYGRRMVYMVDQRVTRDEGCTSLQNNHLLGALALSNSSNFTTGTYDYTMWALLSYGKDGQGAVGIQGAADLTGPSRIQTGNTNAASINNAFFNASEVTTYAPLGLVNKLATNTYTSGVLDAHDDIVWVAERTKNTCALGASASYRDFRISGTASVGNASYSAAALADVNGDSWPDMVIGFPAESKVRVIFGKKYGWTEPATAYDSTAVNGTTGFTINTTTTSITNFGATLATGNINGDNYEDIVICGTPASTADNGCAVIFGKSSFAANVDVTAVGFTSDSNGFLIKGLGGSVLAPSFVSVGDINTNGGTGSSPAARYDDISLPFYNSGTSQWAQGIIYGKSSGWADVTMSAAYLDGTATKGIYFKAASPVASATGDVSYGASNGSTNYYRLSAICDINRDGYKDLIVPGSYSDASVYQRIYVVIGDTTASLTAGDIANESFDLGFPTMRTSAGTFQNYSIKGAFCKDINSDNYDDVLIFVTNGSNAEYIYVYYGATGLTAATANVNMESGYSFRIDLTTANAPTWQNYSGIPQLSFADINGDAATDIIISRSADNPYFSISGTTFSVNTTNTVTQRSGAGSIFVIYQPSTCYAATCWASAAGTINFTGAGIIDSAIIGAEANDGATVEAVGDMNKDGKDDLLIGSRLDPNGGYFMFGKSSWPTAYDLNCTRNTGGAHCPTQINTR